MRHPEECSLLTLECPVAGMKLQAQCLSRFAQRSRWKSSHMGWSHRCHAVACDRQADCLPWNRDYRNHRYRCCCCCYCCCAKIVPGAAATIRSGYCASFLPSCRPGIAAQAGRTLPAQSCYQCWNSDDPRTSCATIHLPGMTRPESLAASLNSVDSSYVSCHLPGTIELILPVLIGFACRRCSAACSWPLNPSLCHSPAHALGRSLVLLLCLRTFRSGVNMDCVLVQASR